jgi:uncharacterized protein YjiS (DUF1127 family)
MPVAIRAPGCSGINWSGGVTQRKLVHGDRTHESQVSQLQMDRRGSAYLRPVGARNGRLLHMHRAPCPGSYRAHQIVERCAERTRGSPDLVRRIAGRPDRWQRRYDPENAMKTAPFCPTESEATSQIGSARVVERTAEISCACLTPEPPLSLTEWRVGTTLAAVRETIARWRLRVRIRSELMLLNDGDLRDIRWTRAEAEAESRKPFWRA